MIKDPLSGWLGPDPYDELASAGITPATPHDKLLDASFALLAQGKLNPGARRAWDQLRMIDRRLVVDLLRYQIDVDEQIAAARTLPAPPVEMIEDFEFPSPSLLADLIRFDR